MRIAIGCDHAGPELKAALIKHLERGHQVLNVGTDTTESVDYPVYAEKVARAIQSGDVDFGILICGTGVGMSMVANRFMGIRAANVYDVEIGRLTRQHNDANVLCLGARFLDPIQAFEIVDTWLSVPFEGGRHQKRIDMFDLFEIDY